MTTFAGRKGVRAVVVHNRVAGHAISREREFLRALAILEEAEWTVEVRVTSGEGHASDIAREAAASGAEVVIAAGGDGTINEVIQGLAHTGSSLGALPLGTVNVWSREAGYSSRVGDAARQLVSGRRVTLDLGRVGDRFFLLMVSVGLDAEVTGALGGARDHKQRLGILPYIVRTAQLIPRYRGAAIEIGLDGRQWRHDALMVLVSNTRLYGGVARPIPRAVANDGMLDVRVFAGSRPVHTVQHLLAILMSRLDSRRSGEFARARRVSIAADPPLAVQVDGDPIGMTPIEIVVEHHALDVVVPATYDRSLISPHHA